MEGPVDVEIIGEMVCQQPVIVQVWDLFTDDEQNTGYMRWSPKREETNEEYQARLQKERSERDAAQERQKRDEDIRKQRAADEREKGI